MAWMVAVARWNDLDIVHKTVASDFDCYCPMFRERVVVRGRSTWRARCLFGRYFFISHALHQWTKALSLPCVSILMADQQPALIDDDEIEGLRKREIAGYIPVERQNRFRRGDRVLITQGSMRGVVGFVESAGSITVISAHGIRVRVAESRLGRVAM